MSGEQGKKRTTGTTGRGGPLPGGPEGNGRANALGQDLQLRIGQVVAYFGGLQMYLVKTTNSGRPRTAVSLGGGGGLIGARQSVQYPTGTTVLVATNRVEGYRSEVDFIIASLPGVVSNDAMVQADQDVMGAAVGWLADQTHSYVPLQHPADIRRTNFNNGQPVDSLSGEWGIYSPLGPAAHVGLLMSYLRASDRAGIWCYKQDELVRLVAKNHQIHTFGREYEDNFDAGELLTVDSQALYPWEAFGAASALSDQLVPATADYDGEADPYSETNPTFRPPIAPVEDAQRGIFRMRRMTGYAADMDQRFVCLPLLDAELDSYGANQDKFPGVYREVLGPDGSLLIQSAKSLTFEKWGAIPYPVELRKPHDPEGDRAGDEGVADEGEEEVANKYQASGRFGEQQGDLPHYRKDFEFIDDEETPELRAMLGLELHGFLAKQTMINLIRHRADWYVAEEQDNLLAEAGTGDDGWTPLNIGEKYRLNPDVQWMPLPKMREVPIDHRYKKARYFGSRSALQMMDDGSVVLEDGYGSQLIMSGGSIVMTAPNDVMTLVGRDAITQAPRDIVHKAGRDVDVTSSYGDLRLKAEYNLLAIGGNSQTRGGVLVESRTSGTTSSFSYAAGTDTDIQGLVLSNRSGMISVLGQDIGICASQAGGGGLLLLRSDEGQVHIDTSIFQAAVSATANFLVGPATDGDPFSIDNRVSYLFSPAGLNLGVRKDAGDSAGGVQLVVNGNILVKDGVSDQIDGDVFSQISNALLPVITLPNDILFGRAFEDGDKDSDLVNNYWNMDATSELVRGSLRTPSDYGTVSPEAFRLFEMRWQQMARDSGTGGYWRESVVQAGSRAAESQTETMPWPGVQAWRDEQRYKVVNFNGTSAGEDQPAKGGHFNLRGGVASAYSEELDKLEQPAPVSVVEDRKLEDSFLVTYVPTKRT